MTQEGLKELVAKMTLEEKAAMCSGADFWHTEAVERLEQTGTEIWRTADSGAVNVWTDGKRMYIKGYKKQNGY